MAENLREVIARKLSNSQTSNPAPTPKVKVSKKEEEDEDIDDEIEEEETPVAETPIKPKKVAQDREQEQIEAIFREIELLQNNGRFRVELLHQLNGINKSLNVISDAIIELIKPNEK